MQTQVSRMPFNKWKRIEIMLALLFWVSPFYFHSNFGGLGLGIPNSVATWIMSVIIIAYSFYLVLKRSTFVIPKYFIYIVAFPILITLSGFITGVEQSLIWLFRLLFIWGGAAYFFSLFQHRLKQGREDRILFIIVVSALLQGLVGIAQFFLQTDMPYWLPVSSNGVPSGLFQQINNHASYQVTAILVAIYLITRPFLIHSKYWMKTLLVFMVACAGFLVSISGSRIAALTLVLGLLTILPALWQRLKTNKNISLLICVSLTIGIGSGQIVSDSRLIDKTLAMQSGYSGAARLGIYSITSDLIRQQPVFGHGIGSFGRVFQYERPDFYKLRPEAVLPDQYVGHPHNETLLWLVEGGVIAGIGLLAVLMGVILSLKRIGWQRGGSYAAILLPISLHTQVEMPFYISANMWFLFLTLLAVISSYDSRCVAVKMSSSAMTLSKTVYLLMALISIIFLFHTAKAQRDFIAFYGKEGGELGFLSSAYNNPYLRPQAILVGQNVILYNGIKADKKNDILNYIQWGEQSLLEEPSKPVYYGLLNAYNYLGEVTKFCNTLKHSSEIYPQDQTLANMQRQCKQ